MIYEVKGSDETVENVDILGEVRKVGERIELDEEVAAPLVEAGKLDVIGDQNNTPEKVEETDGSGQLADTGEMTQGE